MKANKSPGGKIPPQWAAVLWYLPVMLFLLWMWQQAFSNLAIRTIPYSEFKNSLRNGEVSEVMVKQDTVEGKITPHVNKSFIHRRESDTNATAKAEASDKPYLFRTIRVDDPDLEAELEKAHVSFSGTRP